MNKFDTFISLSCLDELSNSNCGIALIHSIVRIFFYQKELFILSDDCWKKNKEPVSSRKCYIYFIRII